MDALSQALNNAAQNSRNNNDTLYVENLDDIGDPVQPEVGLEPDPNYPPYVVVPKPPDYNPDDVAFKHSALGVGLGANAVDWKRSQLGKAAMGTTMNLGSLQALVKQDGYAVGAEHSEVYKQMMAESKVMVDPNLSQLTLNILDYKTGELINSIAFLHEKVDAINNTIALAASTMPSEPDHKHRSLHEWDNNYLINELVERENSLMPFYFELLKRIPPDLQPYVQESMNGKYQSLSVLSKLCAALSYGKPQPQQAGLSPEAEQRLDDAFNTVMPQTQQSTIPRAPFPIGYQAPNSYRG